jgi:hypothetical protein
MYIKKPWIDFRPIDSFTPSEIIEEMFIPRGDFWDRSWMFSDHVGSLVNIVALGFALFRRTGDAVAFDAVMKTWILGSETGEARRSEAEKPTTTAAAAVLSTESHVVAATGALWRGGQQ